MKFSRWILPVLLSLLAGGQQLLAQQAEEFPPIDNAVFFGVKTVATVTQRFEIYDPHSLADLQAVKAMGFDQVILDRAPLHKQATALGLDVVIANWWTHETEPKVIEDALELAKAVQSNRLVGISVMDEPERNSPETPFRYYIDLYRRLKPRLVDELDGVRLEISYWGPLVGWDQRYYEYFSQLYEAADAMRIMPYPDLHEDPLGDVYLMMLRSRRAMRLAQVDLPHVVILQTWGLPPKNKLPTIDELRVMAYQAMLGGAETLSFFEYKPELWAQTPGFTEAFAGLMQELSDLSRRLEYARIESMLRQDGILEAIATWPAGRTALIQVNTNRFEEGGLAALEIRDGSTAAQQLAGLEPLSCCPACNLSMADGGRPAELAAVRGCESRQLSAWERRQARGIARRGSACFPRRVRRWAN